MGLNHFLSKQSRWLVCGVWCVCMGRWQPNQRWTGPDGTNSPPSICTRPKLGYLSTTRHLLFLFLFSLAHLDQRTNFILLARQIAMIWLQMLMRKSIDLRKEGTLRWPDISTMILSIVRSHERNDIHWPTRIFISCVWNITTLLVIHAYTQNLDKRWVLFFLLFLPSSWHPWSISEWNNNK